MTPREFLESVVRPTLNDARADPTSLRKSICAVAVTDMLAAHLYEARKEKGPQFDENGKLIVRDDAFREFLARQSADFRQLRDIAKAQKHVVLDQSPNRTVTQASQVKTSTLA